MKDDEITMATITEDYVSFETAKLLREKGFKEPTLAYAYGQDMVAYYSQPRVTDDYKVEAGRYPLPTLQMACKWLREVHKLHIMTNCVGRVNYDPIVQGFDGKDYEIEGVEVGTTKLINDKWMVVRRGFKTNELAVEAAIKYCLENLI